MKAQLLAVQIEDLWVSQRGLRHPEQIIGLTRAVQKGEVIPPFTICTYPGNKYVVNDGHHRAVALLLAGRSQDIEDEDFTLIPYDPRTCKKKLFGKLEDLIHRVTYATAPTRNTPTYPARASQNRGAKSTSCT